MFVGKLKKCDFSYSFLNISVKQNRSISCYWGETTCFEYKNGRVQQDSCFDGNIRYKFCRSDYSTWERWDPPLDNPDIFKEFTKPTDGTTRQYS